MKKRKALALLLAAGLCLTGLSACSNANSSKTVRLATMTDEEGRILGSMMQLLLEDNGYKVDSKVGTFNNTTLMRRAIQDKQADLSLDYTGRGMMFIENVDVSKYQQDLETAYQTTKEADEKNGIVWLAYAPFNNTDGIAVSKTWSEENNVKTFEDFAKYVNDGKEMKLAILGDNSYVTTAPTCLPGWEETYGFKLNPDQVIVGVQDAQTMAAQHIDGVVAAHVYTTYGSIEALNLVVIEDTKHVSPIYSPAPIIAKDFLDKHPDIAGILEPTFKSIDSQKMMDLNAKLSVDGISEKELAKQYLQENGFLK